MAPDELVRAQSALSAQSEGLPDADADLWADVLAPLVENGR